MGEHYSGGLFKSRFSYYLSSSLRVDRKVESYYEFKVFLVFVFLILSALGGDAFPRPGSFYPFILSLHNRYFLLSSMCFACLECQVHLSEKEWVSVICHLEPSLPLFAPLDGQKRL